MTSTATPSPFEAFLYRFVPRAIAPVLLVFIGLVAVFIVAGIDVSLGMDRQILRLGIQAHGWDASVPLLPLTVGLVGIAITALTTGPTGPAHQRLYRLAYLALGFSAIKLLSLAIPLGTALPYIGLLWSPHATWAFGLLFALTPLCGLNYKKRRLSNRRLALGLLAIFLPLYLFYALFISQRMLIHGDEGQYLLVSHSLLQDGDMDLSNNDNREDKLAFHLLDFDVHRAPSSPTGKLHSIHPIGLSVLLAPAYSLGQALWDNPRLSSMLFMAILAAACLPLTYLWLAGLNLPRGPALAATLTVATTAPFFWYSTQLYPEMPALLICLLVAVPLTHWQKQNGRYHDLGLWQTPFLAAATVLLAGLPFLHPRFLVLAAPLGILLLLQAYHGPRRRLDLGLIAGISFIALIALLAYNHAYSGDIFGPFLPGNAWDEEALSLATWPTSLPGHWLYGPQGLLNSAPIYALCLWGWSNLLARRDQRLLAIAVLYFVTAAVNGLHPIWTFGYCYPARFLLATMPALAVGLTLAYARARRRPLFLAVILFLLIISWDGVLASLALPETGITGRILPARAITSYFPIELLFTGANAPNAVNELALWLPLLLLIGITGQKPWPRSVKIASGIALLLLPLAWSRLFLAQPHLAQNIPPYVVGLDDEGVPKDTPDKIFFRLQQQYQVTTGKETDNGGRRAGKGDPAGILNSYYMPFLQPGFYHLDFSSAQAQSPPGRAAGHLILSHRTSVPARGPWGRHTSVAIGPDGTSLSTLIDQLALGYTYVQYSGAGTVEIKDNLITILWTFSCSDFAVFP
jgi:hypothetical protein